MADWQSYTRGVHQVSNGVFAYMQPNGSWGLNNTALLASQGETLLIDTTSDLPLTRRMLSHYAAAVPAARKIDSVVLTHWHVDHVHGVCADELKDCRIYATCTCADFMAKLPPSEWLASIHALSGDARHQIAEYFGNKFDFSGLQYRAPTDIFQDRLQLTVGDREVIVVETKPCHTRSDSVVYIPAEGVVHTGDLVASGRHIGLQFPFMKHLLEACELMISWDAEVYVPGHGPVMSLQDVKDARDYLLYIQASARESYDKGCSTAEANDRLLSNLGPYRKFSGAHNVYFTITMMYCEFAGNTTDHLRKDYPALLASQWRMKQSVMQRFPELYAAS